MFNGCVQGLFMFGKKLAQLIGLCTLYTVLGLAVNKLGFFIRQLITVYTLLVEFYTPKQFGFLSCLARVFAHFPQNLYLQLNKRFVLIDPLKTLAIFQPSNNRNTNGL